MKLKMLGLYKVTKNDKQLIANIKVLLYNSTITVLLLQQFFTIVLLFTVFHI